MLMVTAARRPNINDILRTPIMKSRIEKFLSNTVRCSPGFLVSAAVTNTVLPSCISDSVFKADIIWLLDMRSCRRYRLALRVCSD